MTAGWASDIANRISSTEIQVTRSSAWKQAKPYPLTAWGLRGATINNVVFMTGQDCAIPLSYILIFVIEGGESYPRSYDSIYKYENGVWSLAGRMKTKRNLHSVSVVRKDQILPNCI